MLQISPQKTFPLVWVGDDGSDVNINFVQAVVRDSVKWTVLSTINLTDNGNQRFTGTYTPPADPNRVSTGFYITITYTVYTDSGYTTKNPAYRIVSDQFLVKTLIDATSYVGGGAWDRDMFKEAIREELKAHAEAMGKPDDERIDIEELFTALRGEIKKVNDGVAAIKFPELPKFPDIPMPERPDLEPVHRTVRSGIEQVLRSIKLIPAAPDYSETARQLAEIAESIAKTEERIREIFSRSIERAAAVLKECEETMATMDEKAIALKKTLNYLDRHSKEATIIPQRKHIKLT